MARRKPERSREEGNPVHGHPRTWAIFVLIGAGCSPTTSIERYQAVTQLKATDRLYQRVQARLEGAYRDMAAADVKRLLELYRPDAIIQSAGQAPVEGTAAIRALWLGTFEKYDVEMVPQVEEVTAFGDIVVVRGRATGKFAPKNGDAPLPIDIWFLQIYRADVDGTLRFWRGTNGPNP